VKWVVIGDHRTIGQAVCKVGYDIGL